MLDPTTVSEAEDWTGIACEVARRGEAYIPREVTS